MTDAWEACSCKECARECAKVPGWLAPDEAIRAIEAGFAGRLMMVQENDVLALSPARCGCEGQLANHGCGRCTFLTGDGRCEIHDSGFKPIECRTAFGCSKKQTAPSISEMHRLWKTPPAAIARALWQTAIAGELT